MNLEKHAPRLLGAAFLLVYPTRDLSLGCSGCVCGLRGDRVAIVGV